MLSTLKNTLNKLDKKIYADIKTNHEYKKEVIKLQNFNNAGLQDLKQFHAKLTSYKNNK